jgi:glucose/arabinose dehydrogenase
MRLRASVVLVGLLTLVLTHAVQAQGPQSRRFITGLAFPAGIDFLSDGRVVVTEREGRVRLADARGRLDPQPVATIPTTTAGEAGLLDVAVAPDDDSAVWVFATEADGASNSVWRVPIDGSGAARVITGLPASSYHNGGGLDFGTDGKLYVSNGETHDSARSQDPRALGGKVYRYNRDGSIPGDNPFDGSPTFALGLRNPFGLAVDPVTGDVWVTENGPESFDELNHVTEKGNYGWPDVSGPGCSEACIDPVLAYEGIIVPTGVDLAPGGSGGGGDLFFGTYGEATIHRVGLNRARDEAVSDEVFLRSDEPVVAVAWGPRGLYYSTPTQVRLIPLAADEDEPTAEPSPEESDTSKPPVTASPAPAATEGEDDGSGASRILTLILLGVLFLTFMALRSKWAPPTRPRT